MLHPKCKTHISYKLFCEEKETDEISKSEITVWLKGTITWSSTKKKDSANPASCKLIELDKFIEFFQVDTNYFDTSRTFLIPDNSAKPYALLRKVLGRTLAPYKFGRLKRALAYCVGQRLEPNRTSVSAYGESTSFMFQGCLFSCDSYEPIHRNSLIVSQRQHTSI